ncbi:MAG TPA: hypothetical protein VEJ19_06795 [Nitrososphaerales archaeon]|nr:hypothetical protein [Nitrososphaerales archaeon]
MPRTETWELLGLLLASGGSAFGLIYAAPDLASLTFALRAPVSFSISADAALGLAGLALTALGSLVAILVGQLKPSGNNIGALLIIWTNLIVLALGDALFCLGYLAGTDLLVGLVSAGLTTVTLIIISGRPRIGTPSS